MMRTNKSRGTVNARVIVIAAIVVIGGMVAWTRYSAGEPARLNNEAVVLINNDRAADALAILDIAVQRFPEYGDLRFNRGVALMDVGRYDEAREEYTRAAQINPQLAGRSQSGIEEIELRLRNR